MAGARAGGELWAARTRRLRGRHARCAQGARDAALAPQRLGLHVSGRVLAGTSLHPAMRCAFSLCTAAGTSHSQPFLSSAAGDTRGMPLQLQVDPSAAVSGSLRLPRSVSMPYAAASCCEARSKRWALNWRDQSRQASLRNVSGLDSPGRRLDFAAHQSSHCQPCGPASSLMSSTCARPWTSLRPSGCRCRCCALTAAR